MSKQLKPEAAVKRAITDLLAAYRIPFWRMNAGDRFGSHNGKTWRIVGHDAGTADILAAPRGYVCESWYGPLFLWIEVKRPKGGVQSDAQIEFQSFVESRGHIYVLASSVDDVIAKLRELGCLTAVERQNCEVGVK